MKTLLTTLLSLTLGALPAAAQNEATTLLSACQRADVVVSATVLAATDPSPEWHRLEFRTDRAWKGAPGAAFAVLEPSGACCGRSLFALRPGDRCLMFLQRRGPALHPFAGARGVLAHDAALVQHVQELLGAADDAARARLLAGQLGSPDARIAEDAAHALATLPVLALGPADRALIHQALDAAVQRGATRTAPLLAAAVRLADAATIDTLLPLYLGAERTDQARLLREGLARCAADQVVERMPLHLGADADRQLRAAELLLDLPAATATGALRSMLTHAGSPRVQLCLVEGLLAGGTAPAQLRHAVPAPVLQFAIRRAEQARRFRTIDVEGR